MWKIKTFNWPYEPEVDVYQPKITHTFRDDVGKIEIDLPGYNNETVRVGVHNKFMKIEKNDNGVWTKIKEYDMKGVEVGEIVMQDGRLTINYKPHKEVPQEIQYFPIR